MASVDDRAIGRIGAAGGIEFLRRAFECRRESIDVIFPNQRIVRRDANLPGIGELP